MIEIIAFVYFIYKIRLIASEKGIEAKPWIWKFIFRWLAVEVAVIAIAIYLFDISLTDERFMYAAVIALGLALISAFFTLNQLNEEEDILEDEEEQEVEEFNRNNQNFDHFR